jgi:hypothetical protein
MPIRYHRRQDVEKAASSSPSADILCSDAAAIHHLPVGALGRFTAGALTHHFFNRLLTASRP